MEDNSSTDNCKALPTWTGRMVMDPDARTEVDLGPNHAKPDGVLTSVSVVLSVPPYINGLILRAFLD
jgi:hypothetical protein